jgi:hypothetical protein
VQGHRFYERTLSVTFVAAAKIDPSTAHGHVYLLCRDTQVAPLRAGLASPLPPHRVRSAGECGPVAVPAAHLHRGSKIPRGTRLEPRDVMLFDAKHHVLTVPCPRGTVVRGIGMQQRGQVNGGTLYSRTGRNTIKVGFQRAPTFPHNEATANFYVACASR